MKKTVYLILTFLSFTINAQQIGGGYAPGINNFGAILQSGVYNGINALGSTSDNSYEGWQHLFVIRHPNVTNNHQFQMATSFAENDRLFFRKIAASLVAKSPSWIELATRGANTFLGNQNIIGSLDIINQKNKIYGYSDPNNYYIGHYPVAGTAGLDIHWYGGIRFGDKTGDSVMQITNGNVGIGTTTPDAKLAVKGQIHAQEVKVDLLGAMVPDYVFDKDYELKTLNEVEAYIKANSHLPEVPSAQEIEKNGLQLGEMNMVLLKKIEELTLYIIKQNKRIEILENKVNN